MKDLEKIQHDIRHSLIVIKRLSLAVHPIIERMSTYCVENKLIQIASSKQLSIVRESLSEIHQESEKAIELYNKFSILLKDSEGDNLV